MRWLIAVCVVLAAQTANAVTAVQGGLRKFDQMVLSEQMIDSFDGDNPGNDMHGEYGCTDNAVTWYLRPGRIFQAQKLIRDWSGHDVAAHLGLPLMPSGSTFLWASYATTDVSILWAYEQQTVRQMFQERTDVMVWPKGETPTGDARASVVSDGSCPTGTVSNNGTSGMCAPAVPICDSTGRWAPWGSSGSAWCAGTVAAQVFNPAWLVRVPKQTHLDDMPGTPPGDWSRPSTYTVDGHCTDGNGCWLGFEDSTYRKLGALCDGYTPDPEYEAGLYSGIDADTICSAGAACNPASDSCYSENFNGSAATAGDGNHLPTDSVGYYLANNYGPTWPASEIPAYYLAGFEVTGDGSPYTEPDVGSLSSLIVDIRIEAARNWMVAKALDNLWAHVSQWTWLSENDRRIRPLGILGAYQKPGWAARYDDVWGDSSGRCPSYATTHMWTGPANFHDHAPGDRTNAECGLEAAGPMSPTQFATGEWENAECDLWGDFLDQVNGSNYFTDVDVFADEAPPFRDKNMVTVCARVARNQHFKGARRNWLASSAPPFNTGADVCATGTRAVCNGPYTTDANGYVRLRGRIEGPYDATATWSLPTSAEHYHIPSQCNDLALPIDLSTCTQDDTRAADPQAIVHIPEGSGDYTATLTVGSASCTTTITKP